MKAVLSDLVEIVILPTLNVSTADRGLLRAVGQRRQRHEQSAALPGHEREPDRHRRLRHAARESAHADGAARGLWPSERQPAR